MKIRIYPDPLSVETGQALRRRGNAPHRVGIGWLFFGNRILNNLRRPKNNHPLASLAALLRRRAAKNSKMGTPVPFMEK